MSHPPGCIKVKVFLNANELTKNEGVFLNLLHKLRAQEIYFHFCHVNFVNGLKGLYSESRACGCPCHHVKIREEGTAFTQLEGTGAEGWVLAWEEDA